MGNQTQTSQRRVRLEAASRGGKSGQRQDTNMVAAQQDVDYRTYTSYNPPADQRPNPWAMRLRPRSSMKPFRGPPWGQPRMYGEAREPEPAPWIVDFKNMQDRLGLRVQGGTAALVSRDASARFQRSQRNPSVGYDTKRKKFTVMVVENGVDAPKGSFRAEEEAVEVCTPSAKLTRKARCTRSRGRE